MNDGTRGSRGQAYTLEGVISAVLVVTAVLVGLQVVDVGPWTSDTTQQSDDMEQRAEDMLDLAAENGTLSRVVRCTYGSADTFTGSQIDNGSTTFERMLNQTFDRHGHNYNIYFTYLTPSGERERISVTSSSSNPTSGVIAPTDSAAVATKTIAIYDDDRTRVVDRTDPDQPKCGATGTTVEAAGGAYFIQEDIDDDSPLYNIVEVRLVVW
ncbi:hypothetical protein BV210_02335 [Halorientalis sp. IM1011]|uniref:DUF7288 family protein n=1 Tax=Halorientalis sp. IM1011 TaxID=1932360 RepID=UPI00097CD4D6|nr:hypothetical protein [Halorientalis sp. IM1011]AQL41622.1 hypothetical protein BV210_02335 [Halorientalis sp. IM1011]